MNSVYDQRRGEYQAALKRQGVAHALNVAGDKFKSLREARIQNERDTMKFDLEMKAGKAKLAALENDPMADPALVSMQKRNLKLGFDAQAAQLNKASGYVDEAYRQTAGHVQKLGQIAHGMNQEAMQSPETFGDMMIEPDLKTGKVTLRPRKANASLSNDGVKMRGKISAMENARKSATDGAGRFDQKLYNAKLQENFAMLGLDGAAEHPGTSGNADKGQYDNETESIIEANMTQYNKTRDEVIIAMKDKGALNE